MSYDDDFPTERIPLMFRLRVTNLHTGYTFDEVYHDADDFAARVAHYAAMPERYSVPIIVGAS